jgi:hypothetical protein
VPELIINIHHVKAHYSEELLLDGEIFRDKKTTPNVQQLVAATALTSMHQYPGRFGGINIFDKLSSEGGVTVARKEMAKASRAPINRYDIDDKTVFDSPSWMGVARKTVPVTDLVMVTRGQTLTDSLGNVIISEGICVEAITTNSLEDLTEDYTEGYAIAEKMKQHEDEIIFAVETAQSTEEKRNKIIRWLTNDLVVDPAVHNYIGRVFANRTDPISLYRHGINTTRKATLAQIFTNQPIPKLNEQE